MRNLWRSWLRFEAWLLDGLDAHYTIELPEAGEPKRAILETWTKAHSAEYQAQAFIDLAFRIRDRISDFDKIQDILITTNNHCHYVIGSGANDPQKYSPDATRETLDHCAMPEHTTGAGTLGGCCLLVTP